MNKHGRGRPTDGVNGKKNVTSDVRVLETCGYVVTEETLRRVDAAFRQSSVFDDSAQPIHYRGYQAGDEFQDFEDVEELLRHPNIDGSVIKSMRISRESPKCEVAVNFDPHGRITIELIGNKRTAEKLATAVGQHARTARRDVSRMVQWLIIRTEAQALAAVMLIVSLVAIVATAVALLQVAHAAEPAIDPNLLVTRGDFLASAAAAMQSSNIEQKLNAVLAGNFCDLPNRQLQILSLKFKLSFELVIAFATFAFVWIVRRIRKLYPAAVFAIGKQKDVFERTKRHREYWLISVALGTLINLASGIALVIIL